MPYVRDASGDQWLAILVAWEAQVPTWMTYTRDASGDQLKAILVALEALEV